MACSARPWFRDIEFILKHKPQSSIVGVEIIHGSIRFTALNLAVWKDATIQ